jgi:hypothetical protein
MRRFLDSASEADRRHGRGREAGDINAEMREALDRRALGPDDYSLLPT